MKRWDLKLTFTISTGRAASAGAPDKRVLHAPMGGPGPEVKHRGIVVPHEDALQHARHNLRAHSEV